MTLFTETLLESIVTKPGCNSYILLFSMQYTTKISLRLYNKYFKVRYFLKKSHERNKKQHIYYYA